MKLSETLVLLQPNCLSWSYEIGESKDMLRTALNLFQQALAETSHQRALIPIDRALEILGSVEDIETEEIFHTNVALDPWEVEDYDRFFGLKHVQTRNPAKCLVVSLLVTYRALLELNCSISPESAKLANLEIETQKIGFKSCVSLLARSFNLCLEEMP